jgi:hypothetical protein
MVTPAVIVEDGRDLAPLFAGPARWGFETVMPRQPAPSPERGNPPARRQVKLVPRAEAAGLRTATVLATVGAIGVIIMDSALGVFVVGGAQGAAKIAVFVVNFCAALVAFWAARAWQRSSPGANLGKDTSTGKMYLIPLINAVVTFLIPYIVLSVEAVIGWGRIFKGKQDFVADPADSRKADEEYATAVSAWQDRVAQFEGAERRRFDTADMWFPVPLPATARMMCVFGGSAISWEAALSTLGASLLGRGDRILIGDLSRRRTTGVLCDLCSRAGRPLVRATLPGSEGAADLFAGLSWADLSTVLAEVQHSAQQDADVSRRERQEDRAVIREVAACLDPDGPVSIARLREALRLVQGADAGVNDLVSPEEYDDLTRLYNEVQRQHGGVLERVTRIERALRDFEMLDGSRRPGVQPAGAPEPGPRPSGERSLRIIEVDKKSDDLDSDRLVDLLFQLLLRHVRKGSAEADVLIVLGADRIRRGALESLMSSAEFERIGMLLFFEHLRDDAIELIGGGGAAAAFFALGNHREAKEASDFIGANYKWVESQHTKSVGESLSSQWGEQTGQSAAGPARTETQGRSYNETFGRTTDYSRSEQRVREAVVDPEVIMGLPPTGMICVEVLPGGRRAAANVDCHPQVVFGARVARQPRALMPAV